MLVSIKKSWGIFLIKQKFNTMAAFVGSKNYQNQISLLKPKNEYHHAELLQQKLGSKFGGRNILVSKILLNKKASIVLNFCLIGKILHNLLVLMSIESDPKTFKCTQSFI